MSPTNVRLGDTIADRYVLVERVGAGGMGTIFRADDRRERRPVALKILRGDDALDVERFQREAEILAQDRAGDVPNCSVTSYVFDPTLGKRGKLAVRLVNFVAPLEATGTPVTVAKDQPTAAKA